MDSLKPAASLDEDDLAEPRHGDCQGKHHPVNPEPDFV
jgi:hypothetical protein